MKNGHISLQISIAFLVIENFVEEMGHTLFQPYMSLDITYGRGNFQRIAMYSKKMYGICSHTKLENKPYKFL